MTVGVIVFVGVTLGVTGGVEVTVCVGVGEGANTLTLIPKKHWIVGVGV